MRKASFSVEKVSSNTDAHNTREHSPKYLIGCEKGKENEYIKYYDYDNFQQLAEARYLEVNKQKMQTSQKEALFEEAVISLEEHHTKDDVEKLFESLNKKYTGHTLINLAIHRDEGHFVKDGIEYYPTMHILQKEDGNWYILDENDTEILEALKDKDFKPKAEDFKVKVNINDFEKVYNYHAHAVFSRFDLETGKSARFQKSTMSERYKFVAEQMQMNYAPDSKDRFVKKSINQHKGDLSATRNAKLVLKKELEQVHQQEKTILKKENTSLKSQNTKSKNEKEKLKEANKALEMQLKELNTQLQSQLSNREQHAQREALVRDLKEELKAKTLTVETMQTKFAELEEKLIKEKEHLKSVIEVKEIDILELKNAQTTLKDELKEVNSQCEFLNFNKKELEKNFKTTLERKDKYLDNLKEIGKDVATIIPIKELKEIPDAVKTVLEQNKSLEAQKEVLEEKVSSLEEKIVSSSNMSHPQPPISVQKEFELIKKEEFEEKEVKTGLFGTEKAKVLKDEGNFLQRTWNIVASKYEDLKAKYNDLVFKFKDLQKENAVLKEKVRALESVSSTKQIEKENLNILESLQSEAKRDGFTIESDSSFQKNNSEKSKLQEKLDLTKEAQEKVREEKNRSKNRGREDR
ncbi:MAG: hypothetical protein EOM78_08285 [Erysipelotrichia bacterium]|nr:hypothetical protein [Erysipelotrichia bacterium]